MKIYAFTSLATTHRAYEIAIPDDIEEEDVEDYIESHYGDAQWLEDYDGDVIEVAEPASISYERDED